MKATLLLSSDNWNYHEVRVATKGLVFRARHADGLADGQARSTKTLGLGLSRPRCGVRLT